MESLQLQEKPRTKTLPRESVAVSPLTLPEAVQPIEIAWGYALSLVGIHLLSLLALFPYYFSWTGVALAAVGQAYGMLGITLCYHRLLTHRGFSCPKWLEHGLAIIGVCCLQDTPARWVAVHRLHHQHSDRRPDPHSPLVDFFWSHMGWLLVRHREHSNVMFFEQYSRDVLRDPFYFASFDATSGWRAAVRSEIREPPEPPMMTAGARSSARSNPASRSACISDSDSPVKQMSDAPVFGRSHTSTC